MLHTDRAGSEGNSGAQAANVWAGGHAGGQLETGRCNVIPEKVGPYAIESKIGSGGMGTVYLGRHTETGQVAAVRVLPASLAREEGFVLRFSREVEAMQALSSPHVVEVYESGVDDETYYYAMEYVAGDTLSKRLREQGRIPWRQTIEYSVQICQALKAAHDAGVIHRDLKPSNLLITSDNQIKLLDFGVAQVFASAKLTKTGGIIGTAEYMSPEQAQGRRATKKSDLYSLGAVMYAMLTARPPFSGKTTMEVIQKHKFGQFDRPRTYVPEIPHWLDDVVCQCLDKDPEKRYPDAYVLSLRLKEILKKVELSQIDLTSATGSLDGTAETIVAGHDPHAIGGTLMRDLMQAELARGERESRYHKWLDNIWILLALLVLILLGGYFAFQKRPLSPEEQFARGAALIDQGVLYWPQARDQYLLPLIEADPETWAEQVEPLLMKIEVQELKKDFGLTRLTAKRVNNLPEAQRFLHMAREYYRLGDVVRAEQVLTQLADLLRNQPEYETLRKAVQEILIELQTRPMPLGKAEKTSDDSPASQSLARAAIRQAEICLEQGQEQQAVLILQSLIALYDGDSRARSEVEAARQQLETLGKLSP